MYKELFKKHGINNMEKLSKKRLDNIEASVMSQIVQEENHMKKHLTIRPILIAAAISATAIFGALGANAATDGALFRNIRQHFATINGIEMPIEETTVRSEDGSALHTYDAEPMIVNGTPLKLTINDDNTVSAAVDEENPDLIYFKLQFPKKVDKFGYIINNDGELRAYAGDVVDELDKMCGSDSIYEKYYARPGSDGLSAFGGHNINSRFIDTHTLWEDAGEDMRGYKLYLYVNDVLGEVKQALCGEDDDDFFAVDIEPNEDGSYTVSRKIF